MSGVSLDRFAAHAGFSEEQLKAWRTGNEARAIMEWAYIVPGGGAVLLTDSSLPGPRLVVGLWAASSSGSITPSRRSSPQTSPSGWTASGRPPE